MPVEVQAVTAEQVAKILTLQEGHFVDLKAIDIRPGKLTQTIAAFANADGGELYVGIDELVAGKTRRWRGFDTPEAANGHLQVFEALFPLGQDFDYTFLCADTEPGIVLQVVVRKTADIKRASDGRIYVRRGAQKIPLTTSEEIRRLEYTKGIASFETELTRAPKDTITNSLEIIEFMLQVIPTSDPEGWLKKQQLIREERATVCGVLLFADDPQAILPKRSGIKVYRYKTAETAGTRDTLAFTPKTVEGAAIKQIRAAVEDTIAVVQEARTLGTQGLEQIQYPPEAIHEIVTNAVIHRDYSIADDIHIRIYDNRVEVESPGRLPAHITPQNILDERFARNGNLVRLLNKYPNPPNKDVGEGLNTAFYAMRKLGLRDPEIENRDNSVLVVIRHERLASHEEIILAHLETHDTIQNREARGLCFVDTDYKMKRILGGLEQRELIERVPGTSRGTTAYQRGRRFANWRTTIVAQRNGDNGRGENSDN